MARLSPPRAIVAVLAFSSLRGASAGTSLRQHSAPAAPKHHHTGHGTDKVETFLLDVDASVRKLASDAEVVYATLYGFDHDTQASLEHEVANVQKELAALNSSQAARAAKLKLGAQHAESSTDALKVAGKADAIAERQEALRVLKCFLRQGTMNGCVAQAPKEALSKAVRTTQMLLQQHQELRGKFGDVYEALVPPATAGHKQRLKLHLTKGLRARTALLADALGDLLEQQHRIFLLQRSEEDRLQRSRAEVQEARGNAKVGIEAEELQTAQESAFTTAFAEAILRMDQAFLKKVRDSIKTKAQLVQTLRDSREAQHSTLHDLVDLLRGKYVVDASNAQAAAVAADRSAIPISFLQAAAASRGASEAGLEGKFEEALRKKADTHAMLMEVKAMLDKAEPVDGHGAQSVVRDLQGILGELDAGHSAAADMKRRCEAQAVSAGAEMASLSSNFALMRAVQNRTRSAIRTAKTTLENIARKTRALETSKEKFSDTVDKMLDMLQGQARDRRTIEAAALKAQDIIKSRIAAGSVQAADALLFQLLKQLRRENAVDAEYRSRQSAYRQDFMAYSGSYAQLLHERRGHYESSLSSLELYASEVDSDLTSQEHALKSGDGLQQERQEVCAGIVAMYDKQRARHAELARAMRGVLPKLPSFLGEGTA